MGRPSWPVKGRRHARETSQAPAGGARPFSARERDLATLGLAGVQPTPVIRLVDDDAEDAPSFVLRSGPSIPPDSPFRAKRLSGAPRAFHSLSPRVTPVRDEPRDLPPIELDSPLGGDVPGLVEDQPGVINYSPAPRTAAEAAAALFAAQAAPAHALGHTREHVASEPDPEEDPERRGPRRRARAVAPSMAPVLMSPSMSVAKLERELPRARLTSRSSLFDGDDREPSSRPTPLRSSVGASRPSSQARQDPWRQLATLLGGLATVTLMMGVMLYQASRPHAYAIDKLFGFPTRSHPDGRLVLGSFLLMLVTLALGAGALVVAVGRPREVGEGQPVSLIVLVALSVVLLAYIGATHPG